MHPNPNPTLTLSLGPGPGSASRAMNVLGGRAWEVKIDYMRDLQRNMEGDIHTWDPIRS